MALASILLLLIAGWGYYRLTRPENIRAMATQALHDATGAEVHIEQASFSLAGLLQLHGVELHVPGQPKGATRLLDAPSVLITFNPWPLLWGQFRIESVMVGGKVTVYISEDVDRGRFNFQELTPPGADRRRPGKARLPNVTLEAAQVVFGQVTRGAYTRKGAIELAGNLSAAADQRRSYKFTLSQLNATQTPAPQLAGTFNLDRLSLEARLEHFNFAGWQRNLLPQYVLAWWDRFEPTGSLPVVQLGYDSDPRVGFFGRFDVRDMEVNLPHETVKSRAAIAQGTIAIGEDRIAITDMQGMVQDIAFAIEDAKLWGFDAKPAMTLNNIKLRGRIPRQPPLNDWLPPQVQRELERYDPVGDFEASVTVSRPKSDVPATYKGTLSFQDITVCDAQMPYPLEHFTGRIDFDEKEASLDMHGQGMSGAPMTVRGKIVSPGHDSDIDVTVHVDDLPVDKYALEAVHPQQLEVIHHIMDQAQYQQRLADGLFQTQQDQTDARQKLTDLQGQRAALADTPESAAQAKALDAQIDEARGAVDRPVFPLGGKVDVNIHVRRKQGDYHPPDPTGRRRQRFVITNTLDLAGLNVLLSPWPYPLTVTKGQIEIIGSVTTIRDLQVKGLRGGTGSLEGVAAPDPRFGRKILPTLRFTGADLPVDDLLLASIPAQMAQWIRQLNVAGRIDLDGQVFAGDDGHHTFDITTTLHDGQATPFGGKYTVTDLTGQLILKPGDFAVRTMTGKHDQTTLAITADVRMVEGKPEVAMALHATGMKFEDPIGDLLPPDAPETPEPPETLETPDDVGESGTDRARQLLADYQPRGSFDLDLSYLTSTGTPAEYRLDIAPANVSWLKDGTRLELKDTQGHIVVEPDVVTLKDFQGTLDGTRLSFAGTVNLGEKTKADLKLGAKGDRLNEALLSIVPAEVAAALRGLDLRCGFQMEGALLTLEETQDGSRISFKSAVSLHDGSTNLGVPITHLAGDVTLTATKEPQDKAVRLDLRLEARQLRAADRLIAPLTVHIRSTDKGDAYDVTDLKGKVYGGTVVGVGQFAAGDKGWYRLKLNLQDAALDPITHPEKDQRWRPDANGQADAAHDKDRDKDAPTGVLSASLNIEGKSGDPKSKHGRGELLIRKARLYEVPVVMAMLQLINLSWPESQAFDRVVARYLIDGDTVRFDLLSFESSGVQIVGDGTMEYTSHALDLNLYSRNPTGIQLGPLTDAINLLKNELLSIHVTGTLEEPKAGLRSFGGIAQSWRDIFGRQDPPRPPLAPKR